MIEIRSFHSASTDLQALEAAANTGIPLLQLSRPGAQTAIARAFAAAYADADYTDRGAMTPGEETSA